MEAVEQLSSLFVQLAGRFGWIVLWTGCVLHLGMEHHGRFAGHYLHCGSADVADKRIESQDLWNLASVQVAAIATPAKGDQPSARPEVGCPDAAVFAAPDR